MDAEARQHEILQKLRQQERVGVDELTLDFGVSSQTVRADLRDLHDRGLLKRTHGGAVRVETVSNREYGARRQLHRGQKAAMGALAASLIPDDSSVTLNIGTST